MTKPSAAAIVADSAAARWLVVEPGVLPDTIGIRKMRKVYWKKLTLGLLSGSLLLQLPACTETALAISSLASVVTAGGVMYLVQRVID
ncbi:MAG: hypothetical protein KAY37_02255 [Phycisphaerae bacterium]|nr:hypothetical protein [Phycisphaerae bacterium]